MLPKVPGIANAAVPTKMNANNSNKMQTSNIKAKVNSSFVTPRFSRVRKILYFWIYSMAFSNSCSSNYYPPLAPLMEVNISINLCSVKLMPVRLRNF
jgi:hypothetical protein